MIVSEARRNDQHGRSHHKDHFSARHCFHRDQRYVTVPLAADTPPRLLRFLELHASASASASALTSTSIFSAAIWTVTVSAVSNIVLIDA